MDAMILYVSQRFAGHRNWTKGAHYDRKGLRYKNDGLLVVPFRAGCQVALLKVVLPQKDHSGSFLGIFS